MATTALLLIAHGSRQAEANDDLRHVAAALREREHAIVEASYLELAAPGIDEGGARCVEQGAACVVLVPYFLSAGVHVRRDLTEARRRLAERSPPWTSVWPNRSAAIRCCSTSSPSAFTRHGRMPPGEGCKRQARWRCEYCLSPVSDRSPPVADAPGSPTSPQRTSHLAPRRLCARNHL